MSLDVTYLTVIMSINTLAIVLELNGIKKAIQKLSKENEE